MNMEIALSTGENISQYLNGTLLFKKSRSLPQDYYRIYISPNKYSGLGQNSAVSSTTIVPCWSDK